MWVTINKIERSKINKNALVYFEFQNETKYAIISKRVMQFLKITKITKNLELYVVKSFNNCGDELFLIKNVREREIN